MEDRGESARWYALATMRVWRRCATGHRPPPMITAINIQPNRSKRTRKLQNRGRKQRARTHDDHSIFQSYLIVPQQRSSKSEYNFVDISSIHPRIPRIDCVIPFHTRRHTTRRAPTHLNGSEDKILLNVEIRFVERVLPPAVPEVEDHVAQKSAWSDMQQQQQQQQWRDREIKSTRT